jgi:citrate lyase subunit beta/citryl-CoA lyase
MTRGPALLFCPGDRPERYEKAATLADSVIIDLEDAVAADAKVRAREALVASRLSPDSTIVRLNPASTREFREDVAALHETLYRTVLLAKTETVDDVASLSDFEVIVLCESPRGVRNAEVLAGIENVVALTWGAEDLTAGLGGSSSRFPSGRYREFARYARSRILIAAASESKVAYDTVHLDIADVAGLGGEAEDAAASGFAGAMCIHPSQVEVIRAAFRSSDTSLAWAIEVLAAADASEKGVFSHNGSMVDEPVLRQARRIIESRTDVSNAGKEGR